MSEGEPRFNINSILPGVSFGAHECCAPDRRQECDSPLTGVSISTLLVDKRFLFAAHDQIMLLAADFKYIEADRRHIDNPFRPQIIQ